MDVPQAPLSVLKEAIAVYPEVIESNPLSSDAVARWILLTPGKHTGSDGLQPVEAEEVFYYHKSYIQGLDWTRKENELRLHWVRDDVYFERQTGPREGSCYMVRKGPQMGSKLDAHDLDAVLLDGKPHEEIADYFNRCEYFYCYDPYTMYLTYAVFCGCTPIVTPPPGLTEEAWHPVKERYGVAFGNSPDQLAFARKTAPKMMGHVQDLKAEEDRQLRHFVTRLADRFG
ncbi:MAG: hypothetical protein AAF641_12065 [Pseudomonadota bacterium]